MGPQGPEEAHGARMETRRVNRRAALEMNWHLSLLPGLIAACVAAHDC